MQNIFEQGFFNVSDDATPDDLARKRAQIGMAMQGTPRYATGGLGKLATGIVGGIRERNYGRHEDEKRSEASALFDRIVGGSSAGYGGRSTLTTFEAQPQVSSRAAPPTPEEQVGADARATIGGSIMPASLIETESGGNFGALNNEMGAGGVAGHGGRGQFGHARLQDAAAAGIIPAGTTPQQFAQMSPEQQIAVENWHFADIDRAIDETGAIGSAINGVQVTRDGLRAVAHLGGTGGMRKYVSSGGQYNPSDSFGTSLSDYAGRHSGGGSSGGIGPIQAQANSGPPLADLLQMQSNPWLSADQKAVVNNMIGIQQQANDPLRQLQIAQAQQNLYDSQNPQATPGYRQLTPQELAAAGLTDGAYQVGPDGKIVKIGGGGVNVTVGGASEVGTIPQGYEMTTDPNTGARSLSPIAGGPEDTSSEVAGSALTAQDNIALIDSIINDPALEGITGMLQGGLPPVTQDGVDLNTRIDQLGGKAFLQAFESLKGGGSITEREGQAAQNAMARLNRRQSTEAYVEALNELREISQRAIRRANGESVPDDYGVQSPSSTPQEQSLPSGIDQELWDIMTPEERALWEN